MILRHVVVDVTEAGSRVLDCEALLVASVPDICRRHGATVLGVLSRKFEPQGVTVLVVLAESHASLHTWPETERAYIDVFTCGDVDPLPIALDLVELVGGQGEPRFVTRADPE